MPRKKKVEEVIEVTQTNESEVKETQEVTKTNENEEQKVTTTNEEPKVLKGVVIAKGGLRIREEQSLNSNIIDVISYNVEIEVLEELEEWVRVERGYMLKKFIKINK